MPNLVGKAKRGEARDAGKPILGIVRTVTQAHAERNDVARIRTIKPEFTQSETIGRLSRDARLLFVQLWTICDDAGRTRGASRMLASLLYPYDEDAGSLIEAWLVELEREGAVARYTVGSDVYLQVTNWLKHQKIDKPSASRLPAISESSRILANVREASTTDLGPRTVDLDLGIGPRTVDVECACALQNEEPTTTVTRTAQNIHAKVTNLVNGAELRRHGSHAWCSDRGMCVPFGLHADLMARTQKSDGELRVFYITTLANWTAPLPGDVFKFWNRAADEWTGAQLPAGAVTQTATKGNQTQAAARRVMARILERGE